jgi:diaminohydroxyphosphoribosylaminopyrimidine deaminase/5-amino-6-(5-phosphoribosylamino)uracil reductase
MPKPEFSTDDTKWMRMALREAAKGAGYVSPNPMVGCVIVSHEGKLLAKGYHERYGEAHAEVNALSKIRNERDLIDATVYVSLEPCSHYGKTPPCAFALAETPVKRVVVAMIDPNPKVSGKGIEILRASSIQVDVGLLKEEAAQLNEFFLHYITTGRPFVTLKIAQTIDGYTAAPDGSSKWITGEAARARVHSMRAVYDAVMIGRETAMADNPSLTVRMVEGRQPKRVVIDGPGELPRHLNLFSDAYEARTYRVGWAPGGDPLLSLLDAHSFAGQTITVGQWDGHTDLSEAIDRLGALKMSSVLVESGGTLATALLKRRLVDKVHVFISPSFLGGGKRSVLGLGLDRLSEKLELRATEVETVGGDVLITGYF